MARKTALQSELVRCERELSLLVQGNEGLCSNFEATNAVFETFRGKLSTFVEYMIKLNNNVEIPYIKIATKSWVTVFSKFQDRFMEIKTTTVLDMKQKTNEILDEARLLMGFIADTFKGIHEPIHKLSLYMSYGLARENTKPRTVGLMNIINSVEYMSAVFETMGRRMRELQCHDKKFYYFLGAESQSVVDSILTLLDPGHTSNLTDVTQPPDSADE